MSEPGLPRRASLTRQAGALASGSLATQAAQLLLLMVLTRLVAKAQLGGYQQLMLVYGILAPLLVAGIPAALLYYLPRSEDPARMRNWVGQAYLLLGGLGLVTSLALLLARRPLSEALGNPALADPLVVYAPYPFLAFVTAVMPTALVAVGRAGRAAALNAVSGLLALVGVTGAAAVHPETTPMVIGWTCAAACTAAISVQQVRRVIGISLPRVDLTRGMRLLLAYGVPLALTGLAGKFAFQFDRIVVSREFSPALFAVYAVGAVELPIAVIVQQSINSVLVPALTRHFAAGDISGMAALWRRAIRRTSLILLPVFVFFMLTADATVLVLFGSAYEQSADVFRVYLLLVPLRVATYGLITQAIGRTRVNLTASIVLLVCNAILVLVLVGPLDLLGPAVGTVAATYVMSAFYLLRLRGILRLPVGALFPFGTVLTNLGVSALAGVPLALLTFAGIDGLLQLMIGGVVYGLCYLGLLLAARRLDPQELAWVQSAWASARSVVSR